VPQRPTGHHRRLSGQRSPQAGVVESDQLAVETSLVAIDIVVTLER